MANQVAYGFTRYSDVFDQRVTELGVPVVMQAIEDTVAEHTRQINAIIALFAERSTEFKRRFLSSNVARLQPLDEHGRPRPINVGGYYDNAFPIQRAGVSLGVTYEAAQRMTVAEANRRTLTLVSADMRWMRDHVLAALFANAAWTFVDEEHGSLTVNGLANGDAVTYQIMAGQDSAGTDTHYLAQAAVIADATNPFPTIYSELREHPENTGEILALIPTNVKAAVEGLATFHPARDPNLQVGSAVTELVGSLDTPVPGTLLGYEESKVWIAEWPALPNDYLIAVATGGDRALRMREFPEASLQGFKQDGVREDHPYFERIWVRRAGFGAWNRVGAVVQRVGNGAYAIPTNYTSPMP